MPEKDQEKILPGEITVTPSSDASIRAGIESLTREIEGQPRADVILEGQTLEPRSIGTALQTHVPTNVEGSRTKIVRFDPCNSGSALEIHKKRQRRLKKAA